MSNSGNKRRKKMEDIYEDEEYEDDFESLVINEKFLRDNKFI